VNRKLSVRSPSAANCLSSARENSRPSTSVAVDSVSLSHLPFVFLDLSEIVGLAGRRFHSLRFVSVSSPGLYWKG
jgi:hypothetical protein